MSDIKILETLILDQEKRLDALEEKVKNQSKISSEILQKLTMLEHAIKRLIHEGK